MRADDLRCEIDALFTQFLPSHMASRFSGLLSMKPERWSKIDPFRVWAVPPLENGCVTEWDRPLEAMLESPVFKPHLDKDVVVLRCGHAKPSLQRERLRKIVTGECWVFEGFVSVVPDALGLAMNHDGEICVLKRK
jgi:hypothetical protein